MHSGQRFARISRKTINVHGFESGMAANSLSALTRISSGGRPPSQPRITESVIAPGPPISRSAGVPCVERSAGIAFPGWETATPNYAQYYAHPPHIGASIVCYAVRGNSSQASDFAEPIATHRNPYAHSQVIDSSLVHDS